MGKTPFDYMKEGKVIIKDEIEDAIIDKFKDHKDYLLTKEEHKIQ
jgi:hypothetical protein